MLDGWENRQIVFIVRVEAKQQFLSEIPYVGAILSLVSARIPLVYYGLSNKISRLMMELMIYLNLQQRRYTLCCFKFCIRLSMYKVAGFGGNAGQRVRRGVLNHKVCHFAKTSNSICINIHMSKQPSKICYDGYNFFNFFTSFLEFCQKK